MVGEWESTSEKPQVQRQPAAELANVAQSVVALHAVSTKEKESYRMSTTQNLQSFDSFADARPVSLVTDLSDHSFRDPSLISFGVLPIK
ncbi:hypothetical protein A6R68_18466, partial [Neotoma lepida]